MAVHQPFFYGHGTMVSMKITCIVGVSGGPDSMALLDYLLRFRKEIPLVVHINYQRRKTASRDQQLVETFCKQNKLPCEVVMAPIQVEGNFQDFARQFRFQKFFKLAKQYCVKKIYLGHHQDDLLETLVMQMLNQQKGSPLGLLRKRRFGSIDVIRPLLDYSKDQLVDYCKHHQVPYGLDETNQSLAYRRNLVRQALASMSKHDRLLLLDYSRAYNRRFFRHEKKIQRILRQNPTRIAEISGVDSFLLVKLFLRKHFPDRSFHQKTIESLLQAMRNNKTSIIDVGQDQLLVQYGFLSLYRPRSDFSYSLGQLEPVRTPWFHLGLRGKRKNGFYVDVTDFPIIIRSGRPDDVIHMPFGRKKLNRFWIDRKIRLDKRYGWPVVENREGKIIFVYGLGCDKNRQNQAFNAYLEFNGIIL